MVKRGKCKTHGVNISKSSQTDGKSPVVPHKTKRLVEDSLTGRFGAVQEALNVLLNADVGISKRRHVSSASIAFHDTMFLSDISSNGFLASLVLPFAAYAVTIEVQLIKSVVFGRLMTSNHDLSMILDALLKTQSRSVLLDIINKNGLQLLHNLMKRYRKEFNKIPILRKLLKVLEYLAETKILTLENIIKPSLIGAESFKESMLSLTEHTDKQVHQIARNFRDRWIPRSARKINWVERDVERVEVQANSNIKSFTTPHSHSFDRDRKPSEVADNNFIKESLSGHMPPVDATAVEGSSVSTGGTRPRKRKSRWDQPGDIESPSNKEVHLMHDDGDAPPGFSSPINRQSLPSNAAASSTSSDSKPVTGYPQERYISRLPIAFGVPTSVFRQTEGAAMENPTVAPATTFHPFPPLPSYPREESWRNNTGPFNQRFRNTSNTIGRRYFKQQKWTNHHQWNPNKNGSGGFTGPNWSDPGAGVGYGSYGNGFYHH